LTEQGRPGAGGAPIVNVAVGVQVQTGPTAEEQLEAIRRHLQRFPDVRDAIAGELATELG
jgi:hypothetical protein